MKTTERLQVGQRVHRSTSYCDVQTGFSVLDGSRVLLLRNSVDINQFWYAAIISQIFLFALLLFLYDIALALLNCCSVLS